MDGAYLDAFVGQTLEDAGEVFLIARDPVQGLDDEDIEGAVTCRIHHAEKSIAPHDRRPGFGVVMEFGHDLVALLLRKGPAQIELILDGPISLQIA
nr:hypothetical protein [Aminobacter aminovorans]